MSGYPIGAVLSGLAAAQIIPAFGWRAMFQTAGVATLVTVPLIFFFLAESLEFLLKNNQKMRWQKANDILRKMNKETLPALPPSV